MMNRFPLVLAVLSLFTGDVLSQQFLSARTWVYLRDKPPPPVRNSVADLAAEYGISSRSLQRRSKVAPSHLILDHFDRPVSTEYIRQIEATGVTVMSVSRWLNAVSVAGTPAQVRSIGRLPFVYGTRPVAVLTHPPVESAPIPAAPLYKRTSGGLNYGPSLTQLANIRVTDLHDLGITGYGVLIGIIDDGFNNHRSHVALKDIDIADEFDFIHRIVSTQHQSWESPAQGNHGAATLSALAGFEEGMLIGAAYGASVMLAKTEMDSTEVQAEEDLYVEALEWMEQAGADVVSTSLGYVDWYSYDSLNGSTAITTKAARIAARKGVLLVTAMGNEGWYQTDVFGKPIQGLTGTMIAPADADSILAVGATHSDGEIAAFSSTGPTADARVKPDAVAQGVSVVSANGTTTDGFISASGTSLSTPLVAGVATLLLSAQPGLTPLQVREAILQTARQINDPFDPSRTSVYPNNFYGHGMVDAYSALLYHGLALSSRPRVVLTDTSLSVYVSIVSDATLAADSLGLVVQASASEPMQYVPLEPTQVPHLYYAMLLPDADPTYPRGYIKARDIAGRSRSLPPGAPDSLFVFSEHAVADIPELNQLPTSFVLDQNFPNPFNAGTMVSFRAPGSIPVEVRVYDLLGRTIKTLYKGLSAAGPNSVRWDGDTDAGSTASTGVYVLRLQFPDGALSVKMLLLR